MDVNLIRYYCDGCREGIPRSAKRFHCSGTLAVIVLYCIECYNYDLCEKCRSKGIHDATHHMFQEYDHPDVIHEHDLRGSCVSETLRF